MTQVHFHELKRIPQQGKSQILSEELMKPPRITIKRYAGLKMIGELDLSLNGKIFIVCVNIIVD